MAKIRVHELAKELGIPSKDMVSTLQGLGLDVKNHMSTMEDSQASWVRRRLGNPQGTPADAEKTKPVSPKEKPVQPSASAHQPQPKARKESAGSDRTRPTEGMQQTGQLRPQQGNREGTPSKEQENKLGMNNANTQQQSSNPQPDQRTSSQAGTISTDHGQGQTTPRPAPRNIGDRSSAQTPQRSADNRNQPSQRPMDNRNQPARPMDNRNQPARPMDNRNQPARPMDNRNQTARPMDNRNQPARPMDNRNQPARPMDNRNQPARPMDNRNQTAQGQGAARPAVKTTNSTAGGNLAGKKPPAKNNKNIPQKPALPRKDYSRPQKKGKHKKRKEEVELETPAMIAIGESIQVRDLADKLHKTSAEIVKKLMELGTMVTINQEIDYETVEIVCSLFSVEVEHEVTEEQQILEEIIDSEESLVLRSPIVTVMGHVDHGKTSLLDKIRKADVVSGEAGGITQHIGAYQVKVKDSRITFIDTPGHEAFTAMRARGANLTDIVILVVAADDGVMPQTIEAINHIKAAKVPFIVALNKIDKPDVNPDKVMQQLTEYSIVAEEWGGETMFIPVSAKTGFGIDTLLEMLLLVAEVNELKANPNRIAEGIVIEGELDKGKGAVATVLVQKGTLNVGDCVICGANWARVRAMTDYRGRKVDKATPSMPVEITGWSDVPEAGEKVQVCEEKIAKEIATIRTNERKIEEQKRNSRISLDDFFKQMQDADVKELNLIIKGDVQGSIEALAQSLLKLSTSEVKVNVIHSAAGAITETDVMLASASNAIIIGFNVRPDVKARKYAEEESIDVRLYRVIYEAIEDVIKAMTGLLDPVYKEKYLGRAEVRETFRVPNIGAIGGCYVIEGKMQRNAEVRVLRDGVITYQGKLSSLRRFKDDVKEVAENYECGIGLKDFNDIKEGDLIEAFVMEEVPRKL